MVYLLWSLNLFCPLSAAAPCVDGVTDTNLQKKTIFSLSLTKFLILNIALIKCFTHATHMSNNYYL